MSDLSINIISDPTLGDVYIYHLYLGPYSDTYGALGTLVTINTHGHTTESDGSLTPTQFAAAYQGKSHGALIMTDHDLVTAQPTGTSLVYIQANELSASTGHIVSINSDYTRGGTTDRQTQINAVIADGGYPILAHPKWFVGYSQAVMAALTGYLGIEIFNMFVETGAGGYNPITYPGFDIVDWDYLLTNVRLNIWGIAVDDFHSDTDWKYYDSGRLILFTNGTDLTNILDSLENGNFAADVSNYGVTAKKPIVSNTEVSIQCDGATKIRFIGDNGVLLKETVRDYDTYVYADETYVRIEVVGDYTEDFADALDDRWNIVDGTWTVASNILTLSATSLVRRYILRRFREGDFKAQVDVRFNDTDLDFACLMFNVLDTNRYYMMRLGTIDASFPDWENKLAIGITATNSFVGSSPLDSYSFTPSATTWYTIKMQYTSATGRIQAKIWATGESEPGWQIDVNDTTWTHGEFGFRAADGPINFDNLYINGFKTYYQPIPIGG